MKRKNYLKIDENRRLRETYRIAKKNFSKAFPKWRYEEVNDGKPLILNSLDEVSNYLSTYFPEYHWELKDDVSRSGRTIYTFRSVPHPDSDFARNPGKYPEHYLKVKIVSKITLANKLGED